MNKVKIFSGRRADNAIMEAEINSWVDDDRHEMEIIIKQITHSVAHSGDATAVVLYDEGPVKCGKGKHVTLPRFDSWDDVAAVATGDSVVKNPFTWLRLNYPNGFVIGERYKVK